MLFSGELYDVGWGQKLFLSCRGKGPPTGMFKLFQHLLTLKKKEKLYAEMDDKVVVVFLKPFSFINIFLLSQIF